MKLIDLHILCRQGLREYAHSIAKNKVVLIACAVIGVFAMALAAYRLLKVQAAHSVRLQNLQPHQKSDHPISLASLRKGYALIPFMTEDKVNKCFKDLEHFDALPEAVKLQYKEKEVEFGYFQLKGKQGFVVRDREIPEELKEFLPYIAKVHAFALEILKSIEQDLHLADGSLMHSVSHDALSDHGKSSSLLRLFAYDASEECGNAADHHEDLGLLTIIPPSSTPALEVLELSDTCQWVNVEKDADRSQAIVLAGRTLEQMTKGAYQAAPHRVRKTAAKRLSIVYQLRAEPHSKIEDCGIELTVEEWLQRLKSNMTSINGSY
jgi:isopenicillin N synthase-like dioxygenase